MSTITTSTLRTNYHYLVHILPYNYRYMCHTLVKVPQAHALTLAYFIGLWPKTVVTAFIRNIMNKLLYYMTDGLLPNNKTGN